MKKNKGNGGRKDKHSKILTSKGARDRRIRLSANTAIQFYDVQDRLGFNTPTNVIDWLMKEAKAAIDLLNVDMGHYHHQLDATSIQAFHQTLGGQQHSDHHHLTNNYPFEIVDSRNRYCLSQEEDTNFPHLVWNPNYKAGDGFEFFNREPLQSNFHHTFTNDDNDGLLGFSFEQDIQVQHEDIQDKDGLNHQHLRSRNVQGYLI